MAYVKIRFIKHLKTLVNYALDSRGEGDPVSTQDCDEESVTSDFAATRRFHNGKGDIDAVHIVQSWNVQESKVLSADECNALGRELVEAKFPGHSFMIVTHTDTGKTHNHIIVNPWHEETGEKIENKKYHWNELKTINDRIAMDKGLSVIAQEAKERRLNLPDNVKRAERFRGGMWLVDMCQKADFARHYATSYDEYSSILGELGVGVRVEGKNISYSYSEKARSKRGAKIGKAYDKAGLEAAFKENDAKFAKHPELRGDLGATLRSNDRNKIVSKHPGPVNDLLKKDYSKFTKMARTDKPLKYPHELDTSNSIIPVEELRRARNTNIFEYCKRNNIALDRNSSGQIVLKGRDFVRINEFEWINTRNRTKGGLIEFVAAHKDMSLLQAVAEINSNKRLLVLEQHLGEVKRKYTSFYVPQEKRLREQDAKRSISSLLANFGASGDHAHALMKGNQAQVDHRGVVKLFAKDDDGGAFEFVPDQKGGWQKTKSGTFTKPFFQSNHAGSKATLHFDPFTFLKTHGKTMHASSGHLEGVVCFMEHDPKAVDIFLASNKHINHLEIFQSSQGAQGKVEIDFFNNLRKSAGHLGIKLSVTHDVGIGPSRSHEVASR